ncbi:hypothetical protein T440DRAFT_52469 [Plenodomus tracheiphilus IPT5]|uniref:Uncharacterized protein n=1 Tax=Plenodomus tracheiphilus IPT5 TaxID=1408161 RepID=A0A6A7BDB5_9PLEO|nr:hypothetical protein T440DRAFT_52469 [Plenodomus tracheiphilus IPT5]
MTTLCVFAQEISVHFRDSRKGCARILVSEPIGPNGTWLRSTLPPWNSRGLLRKVSNGGCVGTASRIVLIVLQLLVLPATRDCHGRILLVQCSETPKYPDTVPVHDSTTIIKMTSLSLSLASCGRE